MSIATGTKLGQYEVQDFIGQGAMGLVYRAYHPDLERTGAVKILQAITPDADTVARFRHEAQAIAQLRHPNIVNVYDFGAFQGTPYMIVEYIPGGSLAARMGHGKLDQATALKYLRGIASGLDYAHRHGVIHRDIKPANVLLTAEDTPVLADFGLAKLMQGSSLKSMTGVTTGTPAYMAPEQVMGHQVGPAADRYSLATIAYEMLTGVIPFDGEALMELLYAQVHRDPVPPSSRYPDLGPQVDAVIMRALAKDPGDRWESATAFVDALEAAMTGKPLTAATPVPTAERTVVTAPAFASTIPVAPAKPAKRASEKLEPATEVVPLVLPTTKPMPAPQPQPQAPSGRQRRFDRRWLAAIAAIVLLLLAFGTCGLIAQAATTLTVTPDRAARGDTVTVKATHVPANKAGQIQLWSVLRTLPFQADSKGDVTVYMTIPREIALGDHTVKICWDNSCHKSAPLVVVAALGEVFPTPVANQTPGTGPTAQPSATPSQASGSTPQPTSTPGGSQPTARPTTPPPTAPPTAPPNPCPGNSNPATLSPATQSVLVAGGTASFTGSNFTPNSSVTMSYYAPSGSSTPARTWSVTASCTGSFSTSTPTKTNSGLVLRNDKVVACDIKKGCVSATISVAVGL